MTQGTVRDWPLIPLTSVGPLRFGMSAREVEAVLGPAAERHSVSPDDDPAAPVLEHRVDGALSQAEPVLTYVDGRLSAVDLQPRHGTLTLAGRDLFGMTGDGLVAWLGARCGDPVREDGSVDFPGLGLSLPETDEDGPAVSVRGPTAP